LLEEQALRGTLEKTATIWPSGSMNLEASTGLKSTVPARRIETFGGGA